VRTKQKAALLVEQRLVRDRTEAYHDARALAIELARGEPRAVMPPSPRGRCSRDAMIPAVLFPRGNALV
jgi:hypothetical protein